MSASNPLLVARVAIAALVLGACSSAVETEFSGVLSNASETGVLDITLGRGSVGSGIRWATGPGAGESIGIVRFAGGRQVSLVGTYDAATGALSLTGTSAEGTYTLTATVDPSGYGGDYRGPNGSGSFTVLPASAGDVEVFCGEITGDSHGVFNLVLLGSTVVGVQCGEDCSEFEGTISSGAISIGNGPVPAAIGTRTGDALSGTWRSSDGDKTGTWSGSKDACSEVVTPPPPPFTAIVPGLNDAFDFAVTTDRIFAFSSGEIHACDIGGCGVSSKAAGPFAVPSSVVAAGSRLAWASDFRNISTCDVSGSTCTPSHVLDLGPDLFPVLVRLEGSMLVWHTTSGSARKVERCNISDCASTRTTVLDAPNALGGLSISGVAFGGDGLYVQTFQGPVVRFPSSGAGFDHTAGATLVDTGFGAGGLWIDGNTLVRPIPSQGKLVTCTLPDCADTTDFATGFPTPIDVFASDAGWFVLSRGEPDGGGLRANSGEVYWRPR